MVNFDVPMNAKIYAHRCGRAARLGQRGNAITFVIPNEIGFIEQLKKYHEIDVKKLGVHVSALKKITNQFKIELSTDQRMTELARKCFHSYLAFYYFHGNAGYMNPHTLNKDSLAQMFGLAHTPKFKSFLKRAKARRCADMPSDLKALLFDTKKKKEFVHGMRGIASKGDGKGKEDDDERELVTPLDGRLMAAAQNTVINARETGGKKEVNRKRLERVMGIEFVNEDESESEKGDEAGDEEGAIEIERERKRQEVAEWLREEDEEDSFDEEGNGNGNENGIEMGMGLEEQALMALLKKRDR